MKLKNMIYSLIASPILLFGDVQEISRLEEIFAHIPSDTHEQTLVVFDIDNTLIESTRHLGSVMWGEHLIYDLINKGIPTKQSVEIESLIWKCVQAQTQVQTVDPETAIVLAELQNKNISILCLTARIPDEAECTHAQLHSVGIRLKERNLIPASKQDLSLHSIAGYRDGILFTTQFNKKSEVLLTFLKNNNLSPNHVVFVDDKLSHAQDIESALQKEGISCVCLRFSGADEHVRQFDPQVAKLQWEHLPSHLSNEQAQSLLNR